MARRNKRKYEQLLRDYEMVEHKLKLAKQANNEMNRELESMALKNFKLGDELDKALTLRDQTMLENRGLQAGLLKCSLLMKRTDMFRECKNPFCNKLCLAREAGKMGFCSDCRPKPIRTADDTDCDDDHVKTSIASVRVEIEV